MFNNLFRKVIVFFVLILIIIGIYIISSKNEKNINISQSNILEPIENAYDFGVFIGADTDLSQYEKYNTIVIDAQYFSADEIKDFTKKGHKVYSYLNIGSLENFRDYYNRFKSYTLDSYENWNEEKWMDVSNREWQDFIINELSAELISKGIDGFFIDNCDVYYNYPKKEIYNGLVNIMQNLIKTGKTVIINSGDYFLDKYSENGGDISNIITGINQETVFSSINWDTNTFGSASDESFSYFTSYIEKYSSLGADIYLIEYTNDRELATKASNYCNEKGFTLYISDSIELK